MASFSTRLLRTADAKEIQAGKSYIDFRLKSLKRDL